MPKRLFDLGVAVLLLVITAPIAAVIASAIVIRLGRPVLFRQVRPGLHGEPFVLLKFRTMTAAVDESGDLLPDALRMTRLGTRLRATSLDELPELWNVLKGDMSLVGPRPLLVDYLPLYSPRQARRHEVRPGLTGWAQINGRNAISWPEKLEMDVWYVENRSMALDLWILVRTVFAVVSRGGITQSGHATTRPFTGEQRSADGE